MSKHLHNASRTCTSTLTQLIRNFVGKDGAFRSYSLAEGSVPARGLALPALSQEPKALPPTSMA